jgi:hypothetical protein
MHRRLAAIPVLFAIAGLAACSSDSRDSITSDAKTAVSQIGNAADEAANNAAEVLARNIATQQGEEQFTNEGHPLDGPLTCEARVADGVSKVDVSCTGETKDGGKAALTGTTDEIPGASVTSLKGHFVGTIDGAQVFEVDHLGG